MKIQSKIHALSTVKTNALVVAIEAIKADDKVNVADSDVLAQLDKVSNGFFTLQADNLPKTAGEIRTFYAVEGITADSIIVIAVENSQKGLSGAASAISKLLRANRVKNAMITFTQHKFDDLDTQNVARVTAQQLLHADYAFNQFKSEAKKRKSLTIALLLEKANKKVDKGIEEGIAIATGMNFMRDLGNMPGNECTPKYLAKTAEKLGKAYKTLDVEILKEKDIKELKMGSLLSVSKGSIEPPRLIKMHHKGSDDAPIIFVGKGVTFDSGGISLKPGARMDEMKYDMCGAGSVFGLMKTISELNLPINVMGIVPSVENMPSDRASKPGDIVKSMSGKTIEILNTDAEGRLILCDALTYAQQFKPKALVDLATLTGAAIVALGHTASAIMSNDDKLAEDLLAAGEQSGDRAWQLPYWEEYTEQLKSPYADLQNLGMSGAGTITAGCFLGEFTKDAKWAHIDIAGTAWEDRKNGATGRPVPLLAEFVMSQVK